MKQEKEYKIPKTRIVQINYSNGITIYLPQYKMNTGWFDMYVFMPIARIIAVFIFIPYCIFIWNGKSRRKYWYELSFWTTLTESNNKELLTSTTSIVTCNEEIKTQIPNKLLPFETFNGNKNDYWVNNK